MIETRQYITEDNLKYIYHLKLSIYLLLVAFEEETAHIWMKFWIILIRLEIRWHNLITQKTTVQFYCRFLSDSTEVSLKSILFQWIAETQTAVDCSLDKYYWLLVPNLLETTFLSNAFNSTVSYWVISPLYFPNIFFPSITLVKAP